MIDKQFLADCTKQLASGLTVYVYNKNHLEPIRERMLKKYSTDITIKEKRNYYELKSLKKVSKRINF